MHVSLTYKYALWCSFAYSVLVGYLASWFQLLCIEAQSPEGLTPQGLDQEQFVPDYSNYLLCLPNYFWNGKSSVQAEPPIQT